METSIAAAQANIAALSDTMAAVAEGDLTRKVEMRAESSALASAVRGGPG